IQKAPSLFDKVKFNYDEGLVGFSVLLGSSRFLLLDKVTESLAGRAFVYNLWPLMACEIASGIHDEASPPLLGELLEKPSELPRLLARFPPVLLGDDKARAREVVAHLGRWGGMPELLYLEDSERLEWLRSYNATFLERDLADLARLSDLLPFRKLQQLAMLRAGRLLSYSELARDAGMPATTVRRYLRYLELSYQTLLLPPYSRNLTSSVVKSPKLYWVDMGILRSGIGYWGELTGELFENMIVVEIFKWLDTAACPGRLYFYRTRSGFEVDLLYECAEGLLGIEIKNRPRVSAYDAKGLARLAEAAKNWIAGLVVYRGDMLQELDSARSIFAVPADMLLVSGRPSAG
ncbi:MAG: ATP-binding protein, partial [Deltaproteobacteria bacterium]